MILTSCKKAEGRRQNPPLTPPRRGKREKEEGCKLEGNLPQRHILPRSSRRVGHKERM